MFQEEIILTTGLETILGILCKAIWAAFCPFLTYLPEATWKSKGLISLEVEISRHNNNQLVKWLIVITHMQV